MVPVPKTNIIVDASVVAKWFLADEEDASFALEIKQDFLLQKISISAPLFIFYEVNNLLKSAARSVRIDERGAREAYEGFLDLNFLVYSSKNLLKATLAVALDYNISSYDASYVALSEYLEVPLFTTDKKLLEKVESRFVRDLTSYPLS
ncbi:MAG: hypothetical protein A2Z24_02575 [Candidatus Woykebacteria bacterium RBG_16_44_10]|uniref:PIN domain-containing protein n=1 Tax=Candidatus Woykebacteria bacterium RBG_16_44_10 TaxID=1802597 RepID=A0A1G1WE54_9BACT|nr:MAG: hypothetical protein A2Z24_02575 [Candidatus Woykebacteria bacterium RBG_16_44_10]